MTLRVYDVDRRTGRVVRERGRIVTPMGDQSLAPPLTNAYPPCECPRCGRDGASHERTDGMGVENA
ncbi:hypothetical protein CP974_07630 [Streptomyces fradiae ATCC 10745 = DSM 40063]|nr:hypothetical protein CP974_07630 [Streptomyces fradiae ATCC 10745 = DSM 40063]